MLQDADGRRVGWLERMDAFDLVKTGQVTVLWSGAHPRYLQLEARRVANYDSGSVEKHTKYSHNHAVSETYIGDDGNLRHRHPLDVNPELVWTLKRLPDFTGPIFRAVLDSVISDYVYSPDERGNFHAATPEPPANDDRREHRDNVVCIRSVRPVGDPRRAGEVQKRAA
jgi:hypothetical protein